MPEDCCSMISIEDIHPFLRSINLYACEPGFESGARKLYTYYFLYVHKGKGRFCIGEKSYNAVSGDLFFCSPGVSNSILADEEDPFLLTGIEFDFTNNHRYNKLAYPIQAELFQSLQMPEIINFHDFQGFPDKISLPDDSSIRSRIYEMINEFSLQKKFWSSYVNGILQAFIILVVQRVTQQGCGIRNTSKGDEIIQYLNRNYTNDLTNEKVAGIFHYHPDYVNKIVHAYTGMTLKQYVIDLRIRAAMNLLVQSNLSMESIAETVGYDNLQYFYRIFKKKTGFSPGYLRGKV